MGEGQRERKHAKKTEQGINPRVTSLTCQVECVCVQQKLKAKGEKRR